VPQRFLDTTGDRHSIGDLDALREVLDRVKPYRDFQPDKVRPARIQPPIARPLFEIVKYLGSVSRARLARLAVGAAATLNTFLFATHKETKNDRLSLKKRCRVNGGIPSRSMLNAGNIPFDLKVKIGQDIEPYTIIPLLNGEVSGSGTLVTIDGVRGILTANQCCPELARFAAEEPTFEAPRDSAGSSLIAAYRRTVSAFRQLCDRTARW
jgi:hypothetical protein